ncbi:MAG: O-antigen ligase family protein [Lentisphaerae bacterium]|nr:O-antigen ligase family protein [Lentisphaerota bacterium]
MERIETTIAWSAFCLLAAVVLVAPWCFGAWEAWWFWPFVTVIFAASALFGFQLLLRATQEETHPVSGRRPSTRAGSRRRRSGAPPSGRQKWRLACLLSCGAFLAYAMLRMLSAPVFTDAQRSLLLFLTPFLLGIQVVYGMNSQRRLLLFRILLLNLLLLGLYGILNHIACGSRWVVWRPGYAQYFMGHRASGSYFCPDHYAGLMEITLCMALAVLCGRGSTLRWRIASLLVAAVAVAGVVMSKSRGGGMATLLILAAAWLWGLREYRPRVRWALRGTALACTIIGLLAVSMSGSAYVKRFGSWFRWEQAKTQPFAAALHTVSQAVHSSSRWIMLSGAMEAWTSSPLTGIGPGMHQNIWPHVATSDDGDRAQGIWPTRLNNRNYSYEVHNDWAQLLEEYGLIGLVLAAAVMGILSRTLLLAISRNNDTRESEESSPTASDALPIVLSAWLALIAMAFHSLGDFNLQIPATTWLFAVIVAAGVGNATRRGGVASR